MKIYVVCVSLPAFGFSSCDCREQHVAGVVSDPRNAADVLFKWLLKNDEITSTKQYSDIAEKWMALPEFVFIRDKFTAYLQEFELQ